MYLLLFNNEKILDVTQVKHRETENKDIYKELFSTFINNTILTIFFNLNYIKYNIKNKIIWSMYFKLDIEYEYAEIKIKLLYIV